MSSPVAQDVVEAGLADLTRRWLRGVAAAGFVPGVRARARAALHELLEEVVAAVRAEPFDAAPGYRIGVELVELRMSAPAVLGTTVRLLGGDLPALLDGDEAEIRARVLALLEELATGFVTAQRLAAVSAAEQMNRSEKIHWRRVQTDLQKRLQEALLHERQTGLPNRQHLHKHLGDRIDTGIPRRIGLCLLSLDGFAELTDALGPDNGDLLLVAVAGRLRGVAEQGGYFLAHLGDDLFALLVPGTTGADEAVKAADKARRALSVPFPVDDYFFSVGLTAGVVEQPVRGTRPEDWLRDAHLALDWAREDHQEHAVFESGRAERDRRRHRFAAAMPAALAKGEFVLHYQPLYRLGSREIVGVEALARWERPDGERTLPPQQFIALAERTGLIRPLGRDLLEAACRQGERWRQDGHDLIVSVNLSPVQLADPGLVGDVAEVLHRTRFPADRLQLEITESAAVDERQEVLRRLTDLGLRLAVDDFGTGYSSLAMLPRLPVSSVKIAAELVDGLGTNEATAKVLRHTIDLCHALGIAVTAEGIETVDQEDRLVVLGCELGQGFGFARPAPADKITARMV